MPSSQFILAYHNNTPAMKSSLSARAEAADAYVRSLHRRPGVLRQHSMGSHVGILTWTPENDQVGWPQFAESGGEAAAWIGIPEHDAMAEERPDVLAMAAATAHDNFDPDSYGAPFACLYLRGATLSIVNDSLGLARLFEFSFPDMTVWATRPGLAHVFAAHLVDASEATWSGMATLGWNLGGHTHIGDGQQLAGSRRITAGPQTGVLREDHYADWVHRSAIKGSSWEEASAGMVRTMSLGQYFPKSPIADLSGGKDSRLLAAAALTSGVTDTVRTVRSDHGEVETAEHLVSIYPGKITHLVTDVATPRVEAERTDFIEHVTAAMRSTEGATVPFTALRGPTFGGYTPLVIARFNGHGGEALHGGEYYKGAWAERLEGQGISGAIDRLSAMVSVARATSTSARERTMETVRSRLNRGFAMGIETAHGLLNYHYSAERMPFWASSSPNRSVITPYYSSGLLHQIGRTFTGKTEFEQFYSEIMASLVPAWTDVPFYRPSGGSRRASRFFWESFDWKILRDFSLERMDSSENFEPDGMRLIIDEVGRGGGSKSIEATFSRFLWEVSVGSVVDDINDRVVALQTVLESGAEHDRR